jgi:hypothetical protein
VLDFTAPLLEDAAQENRISALSRMIGGAEFRVGRLMNLRRASLKTYFLFGKGPGSYWRKQFCAARAVVSVNFRGSSAMLLIFLNFFIHIVSNLDGGEAKL